MKFTLTQQQFKMFKECLEVTIKEVGLSGLYTIVELVQLLENPIQKNEDGSLEYTFTEEHIKGFSKVFDVTLKTLGISAAANITSLDALLKNPNLELEDLNAEQVADEPTEEA